MTDLNKKLGVGAAVLLVLAVLTYRHDAGRAERFEAGQKLLQNLNPDEIAQVSVTGAGEAASVTLDRQGEVYAVAEREGYIARNEDVNRLVRDLLDVQLNRRMGEGDSLAEELGFQDADATSVVLSNANGDDMVALEIGSSSESGGRYVRRTSGDDQSIYRTEGDLSVSTDPSSYLNKEILDHSGAEVVRIEGPDFVLAKQQDDAGKWQGDLELDGGPASTAEINKLSGVLNRLAYDEVYLANAAEVANLRFDRSLLFELDDQSGYRFEVATRGDDSFIRVLGVFNVDRLEVTQEETEEELEQKAEVLRRSDEIAKFDQYHGSWVYQLSPTAGDTFALSRKDLLE